jgi:hypothetical protein
MGGTACEPDSSHLPRQSRSVPGPPLCLSRRWCPNSGRSAGFQPAPEPPRWRRYAQVGTLPPRRWCPNSGGSAGLQPAPEPPRWRRYAQVGTLLSRQVLDASNWAAGAVLLGSNRDGCGVCICRCGCAGLPPGAASKRVERRGTPWRARSRAAGLSWHGRPARVRSWARCPCHR